MEPNDENTERFLKQLSFFLYTSSHTMPNQNVRHTTNARIPPMINEISASNNSDSFESDIIMLPNPEQAGSQMDPSHASTYFQPTAPQAGSSLLPPPMFFGLQAAQTAFPSMQPTNARSSQLPLSMYMQSPMLQAGRSQMPAPMFMGSQVGPSHMSSSMFMRAAEIQAGAAHLFQQACISQTVDYAIGTYTQPDTIMPPNNNWPAGTEEELMKVEVPGYTKPPQDRTPEIVNLVGSDSDAIVHDAGPCPTPLVTNTTEPAHRHHQPHSQSHSDSDSAYEWNSSRHRRQHRRQHETDASTTSASSHSTPEGRSTYRSERRFKHRSERHPEYRSERQAEHRSERHPEYRSERQAEHRSERRSKHRADRRSEHRPDRHSERRIEPLYLHSDISSASDFSSDDEKRSRARHRRRLIAAQTARHTDKHAHRRDSRREYRDVTRIEHHPDANERRSHKSHSRKDIKSYDNNKERGYVPGTTTINSSASGAAPAAHKSSSKHRRHHRDSRERRSITRNTDESNSSANHSIISNADSRPLTREQTLPHSPQPRRSAGSSVPSDCPPINLNARKRTSEEVPLNLTLEKRNPSSM